MQSLSCVPRGQLVPQLLLSNLNDVARSINPGTIANR